MAVWYSHQCLKKHTISVQTRISPRPHAECRTCPRLCLLLSFFVLHAHSLTLRHRTLPEESFIPERDELMVPYSLVYRESSMG